MAQYKLPNVPKGPAYPGFPEAVYMLLDPAAENPTDEEMREIERRCTEEGILDPSDDKKACAIFDTILCKVLYDMDVSFTEAE